MRPPPLRCQRKPPTWKAGISTPVRDWCLVIGYDFPGGSDGKESACNVEDPGSIPGLGIPPWEGNGIPLQYSCLENSTDNRSLVGYIQSMGSQMVSHNQTTNTTTMRIMNKVPPPKCQWRLSGGPEIPLTKKKEWSFDTCNNFFFLNWSTVSLQCFG